jgi:hypothetical protein
MKDPVRKRMDFMKVKILKGDALLSAPSTGASSSRCWNSTIYQSMLYGFRIVRTK